MLSFFPVAPKIHDFNFEDNPAESGAYATVQCTVAIGDLPLKITWKFNNETIDNDVGISITSVGRRSSSVIIDSISFKHAGSYTCMAENKAGISVYSTDLNVNG